MNTTLRTEPRPPDSELQRAEEILGVLQRHLVIRDEDFAASHIAKETHDPFKVLVVTILSQNCTDVAALRAFKNLDQHVGVTPRQLAETNTRTIASAIREAGLYRQKAKSLRRIARTLVENHDGDFGKILVGRFPEMRNRLQQFPNVGPKTADVLLSILGYETVSVDTHVNRVSRRLGLAPQSGGYEKVRESLMSHFSRAEYRLIPLLLMAHGRRTCRAIKPLCSQCVVETLCPYPRKRETSVKNSSTLRDLSTRSASAALGKRARSLGRP